MAEITSGLAGDERTTTPSEGRRSALLDIMRAGSVLLVLGGHLPRMRPTAPFAVARYLELTWQRGGWVGVDVFFVLSGFLVSGLLFREHLTTGTIRAKRFLVRRGLKIYPAFWHLMLMTFLVWGTAFSARAFLAELLFVQSYAPYIWGHTWSLAVEEHFYVALAILLVWLSKRHVRQPFACIPRLFAIVALAELALRGLMAYTRPFEFYTHVFPSHLRMDALLCGVAVSYAYRYHRLLFLATVRRWRRLLTLSSMGLLSTAFIFPLESPLMTSVGLTAVYLGAASLLAVALTRDEPSHVVWRALAYLGAHSYSVYLWHVPARVWVFEPLTAHVALSWPVYTVTYWALSLIPGIAMSKLIEYPVLRLRDRYIPATPPTRQVAVA